MNRLAVLAASGLLACSAEVTPTGVAAPNAVVVRVAPPSAQVAPGGAVAFAATVTGTANTAVTWSVQEGGAGGSVTPSGGYTAPASAGTYHVVATSQADATRTAVATVTVTDLILSVAVTPANATVVAGGSVVFTSAVTTTCGTFTSMQVVTAPN